VYIVNLVSEKYSLLNAHYFLIVVMKTGCIWDKRSEFSVLFH